MSNDNVEVSIDVDSFLRAASKDGMRAVLSIAEEVENQVNARLGFLAPTITTQPVKRYVGLGGTKQFSVAATTPFPQLPLSYSAEVSSDEGETWGTEGNASELTIGPASEADNGKRVRFAVTNTAGARISNEAVLVFERGPEIVNKYDPEKTASWAIGDSTAGVGYSGNSGLAGEVKWTAWAEPFGVIPGEYRLNRFKANIAFTRTSDMAQALFLIWERTTSGTLVEVSRTDITSQVTKTDSVQEAVILLDADLTVEEGKQYYFGIAMLAASTRQPGRPGVRNRADSHNSISFNWHGTIPDAVLPSTLTGGIESSSTQFQIQIEFSTKNRIVYRKESPTAASKLLIPRRLDGITSIKTKNLVVTDSNSLSLRFRKNSSDEKFAIIRDHTSHTLSTAGVSQAITGQAGETFDLMTQLNSTGHDTLYMNKTTGRGGQGVNDRCTISHHAKSAAVHGMQYSNTDAANFSYLHLDGTGSIEAIEVGWEPVLCFGDSMTWITGLYGDTLPNAFTFPRIGWNAGIGGNNLHRTSPGNHTAGYLRYRNPTPGSGDLCDMRDCIFAFCGMALNDIQQIGANPANAETITQEYLGRLEDIIEDVQSQGNSPLVVAPNPYHSTNASVEEAQYLITWAQRMSTMCEEKQAAFFTPFWDLVDKTTIHNPIPRLRAIYNRDDGTHINATAVELLCPLITESFESGLVGGTFDPELNRYRLKFDAIVP